MELFPDVNADNSNPYQVLILTGLYGYVLFVAANMIGDGAELLLLVPSLAPLVGSIVLPILGAVPDGLMVLFSGLGEREDAISQVSVGMGAMAGSSVMLLTMPWFLAVWAGRVDLVDGKLNYKGEKLTPGNKSLFGSGVAVGKPIWANAKLMICTCSTYLVIQIPSFFFDSNEIIKDMPKPNSAVPQWFDDQADKEHIWAYVSLATCVLWFTYYLYKMKTAGCTDKAVAVTIEAIKNGDITLRGCLETELKSRNAGGLGEKLLRDENPEEIARLKEILKPFFKRYDADNSGTVSKEEFLVLLGDLGVQASMRERQQYFQAADTDNSNNINFEEFVVCTLKMVLMDTSINDPPRETQAGEEEAEEDDMPEDLAALSPEEQQRRIKRRAFYGMGLGTLLVLIFSDPMCDMLGVIGDMAGVPKFYVAFLLAPLASNASELIAAMKLASKKSAKSMVDSLSSLLGAAVMNNTFCMAIFLFLIIKQNLAYTYKAETLAIVAVELLIGGLALKGSTMSLCDGIIVFACYPFCLLLVMFLENVCNLD